MEHEFIEWLKQSFVTAPNQNQIVLGIGDDAAIIDQRDGLSVVSTDMLADGVHFVLGQTPDDLIGRKSLAVNLSDLAAMGAQPVSAVVSVMFPKSLPMDRAKAIFLGIKQLADQYNVSIIGGDTNRWDGALVINCAVTGKIDERLAQSGQWRMSSAQAGDAILVSGDLGNSIAGKHLTFKPQIGLALFLAQKYEVHAATDITDSLSIDLAAVCRQSKCGFRIHADQIPLAQSAMPLTDETRKTALEAALHDGEDFELLFTVDSETAEAICADEDCPAKITKIGNVISDPVFEIVDAQGNATTLEPRGYVH